MVSELKALFDYYEKEKNIDRKRMVEALSQGLLMATRKSIGPARELRVDLNTEKGIIKAYAKLIVVEKVSNPFEEISIKKAVRFNKDIQLGEELEIEVTPNDMGRIAAQAAKQTMFARLRSAEKENLYEECKDTVGELITGTIRRFDRSDVVVDIGKYEGVMYSRERVPNEEYAIGDRMQFYVKSVNKDGPRGPEIELSRAHTNFVKRLFEQEINEIDDQTVQIMSITRDPGFRTKIAVFSQDPKLDPVGACVGVRGARVKNIVRELNNEKVDIVRWYEDIEEYVRESLRPIKVISLVIDKERNEAHLTVAEADLSKAIGRRGQNAKMTSKLVGMELYIKRDQHAEQIFEGQMDKAKHLLMEILHIDEETAGVLTASGLGDIHTYDNVESSDLIDILVCDEEFANSLLIKAKEYLNSH